MDKPKVTPKDFFLWAGAMVTLYASAYAFVALIFDYLNYSMPDALSYYGSDPYSASVSYEMASLIVLFPLYAFISYLIMRDAARDPSRMDIWIRRWAIYLTLFVAGATAALDLITLIMYFFNGDVTLRFVLKVLVILLVAGTLFTHYWADLQGYWSRNAGKARITRIAGGLVVLITIIAGFFIIGTPWEARLYRFDDQKVSDLQIIQSQVVSYWQAKERLPMSINDLSNALSGFLVPIDPQTGASYEYRATSDLAFELCASFNAPTQPNSMYSSAFPREPGYPMKGGVPEVWSHDAGRVCFVREIDPELYPPYPTR